MLLRKSGESLTFLRFFYQIFHFAHSGYAIVYGSFPRNFLRSIKKKVRDFLRTPIYTDPNTPSHTFF